MGRLIPSLGQIPISYADGSSLGVHPWECAAGCSPSHASERVLAYHGAGSKPYTVIFLIELRHRFARQASGLDRAVAVSVRADRIASARLVGVKLD